MSRVSPASAIETHQRQPRRDGADKLQLGDERRYNYEMMTGRFRILRQVAGKGSFAEVAVELASLETESFISLDIQAVVPVEWQMAAKQGAQDAVAAIQGIGGLGEGAVRVRITDLITSNVDSYPGVIWAAGYMAVVRAADMESRFELYHSDGWQVRGRNPVG